MWKVKVFLSNINTRRETYIRSVRESKLFTYVVFMNKIVLKSYFKQNFTQMSKNCVCFNDFFMKQSNLMQILGMFTSKFIWMGFWTRFIFCVASHATLRLYGWNNPWVFLDILWMNYFLMRHLIYHNALILYKNNWLM